MKKEMKKQAINLNKWKDEIYPLIGKRLLVSADYDDQTAKEGAINSFTAAFFSNAVVLFTDKDTKCLE